MNIAVITLDFTMKLRLTTLLLFVAALACGLAWFSERLRSSEATARWQIEKQTLEEEFDARLQSVANGTEALSSAQRSLDILKRYKAVVEDKPIKPADYQAANDFIDKLAMRTIIQLWENKENISVAIDKIMPESNDIEFTQDVVLANKYLKLLDCKSADDVISKAKKRGFRISLIQNDPIMTDQNSSRFKSLRKFVSRALQANAG